MHGNIKKITKVTLLTLSIMLVILGISLTIYIKRSISDGEKFMQAGRYKESIGSFTKIINLYSFFGYTKDLNIFPPIYLNMGIAYKELKEYDEAKRSLKKIIEIYEQNKFKQNETNKLILEEAKKILNSLNEKDN